MQIYSIRVLFIICYYVVIVFVPYLKWQHLHTMSVFISFVCHITTNNSTEMRGVLQFSDFCFHLVFAE